MPSQEIVPTSDGSFALTSVASAPPANLRKSYFSDEVGEGVYHFTVLLDDKRVYCRELSEAQLDEYFERQTSISNRNNALRANPNAADAETVARALLSEQRGLALEVLEKTIVGWDLPFPYSPESPARLSMAARVQLATKIVQSSTSGEDAVPLVAGS